MKMLIPSLVAPRPFNFVQTSDFSLVYISTPAVKSSHQMNSLPRKPLPKADRWVSKEYLDGNKEDQLGETEND